MTHEKPTYEREAEHLSRSYDKAVGDALELGIQVHARGQMKCLGDLRIEIRTEQKRRLSAEQS